MNAKTKKNLVILEAYEQKIFTSREVFEELTPYLPDHDDPNDLTIEPLTVTLHHITGTAFYLMEV